jgi:hypothetical protein
MKILTLRKGVVFVLSRGTLITRALSIAKATALAA